MKHPRLADIDRNFERVASHWPTPPLRWHGKALGREVSLTVGADRLTADAALQDAITCLDRVSQLFNLYDDDSALGRLNTDGHLANPADEFLDLCYDVTRVHIATSGLFDPTIQPLWRSLADGQATTPARKAIGWKHVDATSQAIKLKKGQKLSFNGIAQGYATDLVTQTLRLLGVKRALIDIGELAVIGGPFDLEFRPAPDGPVERITLRDNALAISDPLAESVGGRSHILHPKTGRGQPEWQHVFVHSPRACLADACSTAFPMMSLSDIQNAHTRLPEIKLITLYHADGRILDLRHGRPAELRETAV